QKRGDGAPSGAVPFCIGISCERGSREPRRIAPPRRRVYIRASHFPAISAPAWDGVGCLRTGAFGTMGKVIAVAHQKGGVGKTTTAVNLAASLAATEHPTLLLDIDPQANGTSGLGIEPRTVATSVYEVLTGDVPFEDAVLQTEMPFLDAVPSHINLVGAEIEMINVLEREQVLKRAL